ncbi:WD40 repeat-like protein [Glarea lozoyensis ATCC 20868]|uniref:WD40 repeat-like protein n=1 Tax=Glarea lozoyensis (strain ATCC 20868 / MF5171) TaxID=1116229 RepID=S3D103_GLAL2|nr:WD40 repeat-like protein [Glarea lozoyensis ATCC 20868]EPE30819.1 WD40 repeat-like protein [Glarea lozoyensis ATCC 20868]
MYTLDTTDCFRITPTSDTYIYDIIPTEKGIVTISSDNSLRLLDPLALNTPLNTIKNVNAEITCATVIRGDGESSSLVGTAGRDGKLTLIDFRCQKIGEISTQGNAAILALASFGNAIAAGTELTNHQASVIMWDARNLSAPVVEYVESHSDDVTEVQFHPSRPQILLSGSTDGLLNIYDTTVSDEEDALHQTINHGHSIHRCNFLNDADIFALSHDEQFSLYELMTDVGEGIEEPAAVSFGDMRELLGGEYAANVVRRTDGSAVLGIGSHSRESFDLIQLRKHSSWNFVPEERVNLTGAHGSEIVRSFCFMDSHKTVLTAGEDGQVKAWGSE